MLIMSPLIAVKVLRVLHFGYCFSCFNFSFFSISSAKSVTLVRSFKWSWAGFSHIDFSERCFHLLVPVAQNVSGKTWMAFPSSMVDLFPQFWDIGIDCYESQAYSRVLSSKCFIKWELLVICAYLLFASFEVLLMAAKSSGKNGFWKNSSVGRASKWGLLLLYNTILKIKGCMWKSLILLCPLPNSAGIFFFF